MRKRIARGLRAKRLRVSVLIAGVCVVAAALTVVAGSFAVEPRERVVSPAQRLAAFAVDEATVPDDGVLAEQLESAIELRRREDFDRMLDARDPGELIEHATLTEIDFDHRKLGIDTLFIVGDELFGYLFRPENGWGGSGMRERMAGEFVPKLRRVHDGLAGGPDAFGCFSCHFKGGPDGAGTQTQNAFLHGDGERVAGADQRNPPHLLGLGPVALLAREMSAELQAQAADARARAKSEGRVVEHALTAKGVAFGRITARPGRKIDYRAIEGVDRDLVVRPFGWKGHSATLRDMIEESLHIHQGLLSKDVQLAVRDHGLDPAPYGKGRWDDVDEDGVSLEIDAGMLATVVGYLAQLEAPVTRPPRDPGLIDAFAAGREHFEQVGCAGCHVPTLELTDSKLDVWEGAAARAADGSAKPSTRTPDKPSAPPSKPGEDEGSKPGEDEGSNVGEGDRPIFIIDVARDGDGPKIEPKYASPDTPYLVHLFSDLKRHDMGDALASPYEQRGIPARMFLTRPLWGLAETAPYLHDGRAPTLHDAIALHGGEAAAARDAYLALDERARAAVRVFLASLSRQPKLFVP